MDAWVFGAMGQAKRLDTATRIAAVGKGTDGTLDERDPPPTRPAPS